MTTRSKQLYSEDSVPTSNTDIYTVPSGRTTILKGVAWNNGGGTSSYLFVWLKRAADSALCVLWARNSLPNGTIGQEQMWAVLEEGDKLQVLAGHSGITLVLSGTELQGVAP